jgi:hypothetical protein
MGCPTRNAARTSEMPAHMVIDCCLTARPSCFGPPSSPLRPAPCVPDPRSGMSDDERPNPRKLGHPQLLSFGFSLGQVFYQANRTSDYALRWSVGHDARQQGALWQVPVRRCTAGRGACERHIILNIPNSKIYELAPTSKIDILPAATSAMGVPDGFAALPSGTWTISDRTSVGRPLIVSISTQTGFNGFSATVR